MLMTSEEYRESLRRLSPKVYLGGKLVESVADEPGFAPGVNAPASPMISLLSMIIKI